MVLISCDLVTHREGLVTTVPSHSTAHVATACESGPLSPTNKPSGASRTPHPPPARAGGQRGRDRRLQVPHASA